MNNITLKIKHRRKSGIAFMQNLDVKGIVLNHNHELMSINQYFKNVIPAYIKNLLMLQNIAKQVNCNMKIKIVGSGISSQISMVEGCIAKHLLLVLSKKETNEEDKVILAAHYDFILKFAKNDLRIVERKKPGHVKARKVKPTNKR